MSFEDFEMCSITERMMNKILLGIVNACILTLGISTSAHAAVVPISLTVTPDILGEDWEQIVTPSILNTYSIVPTVEHTVTIGLSDGTFDIFTFAPIPESQMAAPILYPQASFSNGGAMNSSLTTLHTGGLLIVFPQSTSPGPITLLDSQLDPYDPQLYLYTLDGVDYELPKGFFVPIPAAVWLFGSGLLGLIGVARRRANA